MKRTLIFAAFSAAALITLTNGCTNCPLCKPQETDNASEAVATFTAKPVKVDGKLTEEVWKKTPAYPLYHAVTRYDNMHPEIRNFYAKGVVDQGQVRLAWDKDYLYVAVEFKDQDVVAEGDGDQQHHYLKGDVAEVFLKPADESWYWEMYVTPKSHKTAFPIPGRGRMTPSAFPETNPFKLFQVAATVQGTLNNYKDKDHGWTAEMAISRKEISAAGKELKPGTPWLIFFGRYNYSVYQTNCENSSYPQQKIIGYHTHEDYARLIFKK